MFNQPRKLTRQIKVGSVPVGGGAPISVQSMTTTDTRDIDATVKQIHSLEKAGCDIVRVAVLNKDAAESLGEIRSQIHIPLVLIFTSTIASRLLPLSRGLTKSVLIRETSAMT